MTTRQHRFSALLLSASLFVTLLLLVLAAWLLHVSSFAPIPGFAPSHVPLGTRYLRFLVDISLDKWLLVPLVGMGVTFWLRWRHDRLFCMALGTVYGNLLLVYHIAFILLNSALKK